MRRAAKKDRNHRDFVDEARAHGASVMEHPNGRNEPDLIVGWRGVTCLVEIKPAGVLTHKERVAKQKAFLEQWRGGPALIASSWQEAMWKICDHINGVKP